MNAQPLAGVSNEIESDKMKCPLIQTRKWTMKETSVIVVTRVQCWAAGEQAKRVSQQDGSCG